MRLLVLFTLGTYMDADGGGARPSLETIAKGAGVSVSTVKRHLEGARTAGYLARPYQGNRNGGASTYLAVLPAPAELPKQLTSDPFRPAKQLTSELLNGGFSGSDDAPQQVTGGSQQFTPDLQPRSSTDHSSQTRASLEVAVYVESSERSEEREDVGTAERSSQAAVAAGKPEKTWTPTAMETVARHLTATGLGMAEVPLVLLAGARHPRIERPAGICAEGFLAELRKGVARASYREAIQRQGDASLDRLGPDARAELELYTRRRLIDLEDNAQPPAAVLRVRMLKCLDAGWQPTRVPVAS
ncbi:MAG: hypothetical protein JWO67_6450 [Streptosporangiaceae bacterium]|nr:hypothetical protein [Streptosporangiaceae bacterium]